MILHGRIFCGHWRLMVFGLAATLGCGEDDGIGERTAVRGVVTYNGQPVPGGTVSFLNDTAGGRNGGGDIGPDGSYAATTMKPGDGLVPGKYKVTVSSVEVDMSKVVGNPGGLYRSDLIKKAPKKINVPKKFANPTTSGLALEVKSEPLTYDIKLAD